MILKEIFIIKMIANTKNQENYTLNLPITNVKIFFYLFAYFPFNYKDNHSNFLN